ncbi:MAG: hypothetical protein Q9218_006740 [Villophora microphyllina]
MSRTNPIFWVFVNTALTVVISAYIFRLLFQTTVGWYLRRKTAAQRNLILARVNVESQVQPSDNGGSAVVRGEAEAKWENNFTKKAAAMREVEEKESSGLQSMQRKSGGRRQSVLSTPETMQIKKRCSQK